MAISIIGYCKGAFSQHVNEVDEGYNFILYQPVSVEADTTKSPKPLIITLHSHSASGKDLKSVDLFGTIDALESGMELDAYVLAPQADGYKWDVERIMKDVDWAVTQHNIDPERIYAIGMSMGGNGVADLAAAYPDKIAAAVILAGGLDKGDAANLNKLPLWVIRGMDDRREAIARTDRMVEKMRSQPDKAPRLTYTKINGLDHRQHERLLYMPCIYGWLMSHNLKDHDRSTNKAIEITGKMIKEAYKGLNLREGSAAKRQSMGKGPRRQRSTASKRQARPNAPRRPRGTR